MQVFPLKRREGNWTGKYSREKIRESKWRTYYWSLWIKHPWNTSYIPQVISQQWLCFFKKNFNGEIIFHLKRILKRLCYYKWKRTTRYKFMCDSGLQKFRGHFYHAPNILYYVPILELKKANRKFIFPRRVINWHVLQKAKAISTYMIRFINSEQTASFFMLHTKSLNKACKKDYVLAQFI